MRSAKRRGCRPPPHSDCAAWPALSALPPLSRIDFSCPCSRKRARCSVEKRPLDKRRLAAGSAYDYCFRSKVLLRHTLCLALPLYCAADGLQPCCLGGDDVPTFRPRGGTPAVPGAAMTAFSERGVSGASPRPGRSWEAGVDARNGAHARRLNRARVCVCVEASKELAAGQPFNEPACLGCLG